MRTLRFSFLLALCACQEGASTDPGTRALLHVDEGQFVTGKLPRESGGPVLEATNLAHDRIVAGARDEGFSGTLAASATAVLIGLSGDAGYWVVTAGPPSLTEPDFPTFAATLSFARRIAQRELTLRIAAVDGRGRVGPYSSEPLIVAREVEDGPLRVLLRWDTDADLDLHLSLPNGEEVFAGNINAQVAPAPGQPASDPNAFRSAAQLSLDSNANCLIDGRRAESITFPSAPEPGEYIVRVAAASLCGESAAHFQVEAWLNDEEVGAAEGISLPQDTRFGTERGAGARAFSFRVP